MYTVFTHSPDIRYLDRFYLLIIVNKFKNRCDMSSATDTTSEMVQLGQTDSSIFRFVSNFHSNIRSGCVTQYYHL